jgi:hypothetical protein
MAALFRQQSRPDYNYGVSDLSAGVRTTFPDIWINRVALRWISAISLRTFQFFNGYFLRVNPQVKQFSPNSYSVWWALHCPQPN